MAIDEIKKALDTKMDQSIAAFKHNLTKIRTGRANPALLDTVHVDYYGAMLPLSQVANLSLLDARTVSVQPWEKGMGANEAVKKLVKDKVASEDDQKRSEAEIQKLTDRHIVEVDRLVASKEHDIMAV